MRATIAEVARPMGPQEQRHFDALYADVQRATEILQDTDYAAHEDIRVALARLEDWLCSNAGRWTT